MISDDIAFPPDAVAYVPPAPPYVTLLARPTICRFAEVEPVTRSASFWAASLSMSSSRWTPPVWQPLQNAMLSGVVRRGADREGSQLTPDSPETISTR